MLKKIVILTAILLGLSVISSCKKNEDQNKQITSSKLKITTTLYPLYNFATIIAGSKAEIELLLPVGMEPHDFNPKPSDIANLKNSDLIIYTNDNMEVWLKDLVSVINDDSKIINSCKGIELATSEDHHDHGEAEHKDEAEGNTKEEHDDDHEGENKDPHTWLDFRLASKMVDNITMAIIQKDSLNKDYYQYKADSLKAEIDKLDLSYQEMVKNSRLKKVVYGGHNTFSYLGKRYGLTFLSPFKGFSPSAEPTPKELSTLIKTVKRDQIKYIYFEEILSPKTATVIAKESGTELLKLHGLHNLTAEEFARKESYISLMKYNLEQLAKGLK